MKKLIIGLLVILYLLFVGCDTRKEMRERINGKDLTIVTDQNGKRYVLKHNVFNSYFLKPLYDNFAEEQLQ